MSEKIVTLACVKRAEITFINIDAYRISRQISWLAGLGISSPEREGILNLLEAIQDMVDSLENNRCLKTVIGPGKEGEPAITIKLPEQD